MIKFKDMLKADREHPKAVSSFAGYLVWSNGARKVPVTWRVVNTALPIPLKAMDSILTKQNFAENNLDHPCEGKHYSATSVEVSALDQWRFFTGGEICQSSLIGKRLLAKWKITLAV